VFLRRLITAALKIVSASGCGAHPKNDNPIGFSTSCTLEVTRPRSRSRTYGLMEMMCGNRAHAAVSTRFQIADRRRASRCPETAVSA
jgi:hypothetical protein